MAYSVMQDRLLHFMSPSPPGLVAFREERHSVFKCLTRRVALSDPACDAEAMGPLLDAFIGRSPVVFVQISRTVARLLAARGFAVGSFGCENEIDLCSFPLRGGNDPDVSTGRFSALRRLVHKARTEGIHVFESDIESMDPNDVQQVSRAWLKDRGGFEYSFLTRPLVLRSEPDVRYFWAKQGKTLVAFSVFDPMYRNDRIDGYYQNHIRYVPEAPHGTTDLMTITAMSRFRDEGVDRLSLGLSPLAHLSNHEKADDVPRDALVEARLHAVRRTAGFAYPFAGNEFSKRRYRPNREEVFVAASEGGSLLEMASVLTAMGLVRARDLCRWVRVFLACLAAGSTRRNPGLGEARAKRDERN